MARNKYDIDEDLETKLNFSHLMRLAGYIKPFMFKITVTVILMLVASAATLALPYLTKIAIDTFIPSGNVKGLIVLSVVLLGFLFISGVCLKFRIRTMSDVGNSIISEIRYDIFLNLQRLPFSYYDSRPHGKILVRVVNYVNALSDLLSNGLINLVTDLFSLVVTVAFMLAIDVRLTLVSMIGIPVLMGITIILKNMQRKAWQDVSVKQANMNAYIHESITGVKVTQSFAREAENHRIFKKLQTEYRSTWMRAVAINFANWPMIEIISVLVVSSIYVIGIGWIEKGITVGVLVAFVGYIWRFWMPIQNIGNFYNQLIIAASYLERIFEVIDEKPNVKDREGALPMKQIEGDIKFDKVSFAYEKGQPVISDISFKVSKGESIALVGPTGAGKTTIVNLLSRFYETEDGNILIDDTEIKSSTLKSLRSQMGIMLQDSFLFSGTILENIRYSRLDASDEQVIKAAKDVCAHDFIMKMKDGYQTAVNERGTRLSSGQRQLISFARALLADPRILILDEATSSIDTQTEMALQEGLERLLKGRTSFIIAHRLSTIKNSSRIFYLEHGRIIEEGNHAELMDKKGLYYKLYRTQFSFLEK
jgi:ATP-binding cassette, subfamily B, multidrug efflux pump